jgi:hypothetical protein
MAARHYLVGTPPQKNGSVKLSENVDATVLVLGGSTALALVAKMAAPSKALRAKLNGRRICPPPSSPVGQ